MRVVIGKRANKQIQRLLQHIAIQGAPMNAKRFGERIYDFIFELQKHPTVHPVCKRELWLQKNYRCAIFENKYVVPYSVSGDEIFVRGFVHGSWIH